MLKIITIQLLLSNMAIADTRHPQTVYLFKSTHPCPATNKIQRKCSGYVVDHIIPLACGGADATFNMQFQTIAEGKAKDKWERKAAGCR